MKLEILSDQQTNLSEQNKVKNYNTKKTHKIARHLDWFLFKICWFESICPICLWYLTVDMHPWDSELYKKNLAVLESKEVERVGVTMGITS